MAAFPRQFTRGPLVFDVIDEKYEGTNVTFSLQLREIRLTLAQYDRAGQEMKDKYRDVIVIVPETA